MGNLVKGELELKIIYNSKKIEEQCTLKPKAKKLFGGNNILVISLLARINALENAECIKDIIVQPTFHFHKLKHKQGRDLEGYFSIDVKSRKDSWRIILQPLDDQENVYNPCNIDQIASKVKIIEIMEVSNHYD
ncbi:MAG: hypothetical protein ACRCZJ_02110 [Erysipelotrichaceae bacterium]